MSRVSQARSLGKYFLLVDNMLVVLGFFVVFPLISIRFVDQMGWAALMVGIAIVIPFSFPVVLVLYEQMIFAVAGSMVVCTIIFLISQRHSHGEEKRH